MSENRDRRGLASPRRKINVTLTTPNGTSAITRIPAKQAVRGEGSGVQVAPEPSMAAICRASIMAGNGLQEPRCAYCGKALAVDEPVVLLLPNQPIRRFRRSADEELPTNGVAVHEHCYEERVRAFEE